MVVQPNYQIFAFEPVDEAILFRLNQFAERIRAEGAIEYRLTRESVYRAQKAGPDAATVAQTLEDLNAAPLPQNIRQTLADWGAQHERIVIRPGVAILQTVDAATLDALFADVEIVSRPGRRLAPTAALVPVAQLQPIYRRLLDQGQLPALDEGTSGWPFTPISIDAEGRMTFDHPSPSIFVLRTLRQIAEEDADGSSRLIRASLRQAARNGLEPDAIIETLEQLKGRPLPPEMATLVRQHAKDWGTGALVDAVVLQVEQSELLIGLLADSELKPHLQAIPGAPTLALVRREAAERVRAALTSRGMDLRDHLLGDQPSSNRGRSGQ